MAASPMTSASVGCGCVAAPISQAVASSVMPSAASAIRSVTRGPDQMHAQDLVSRRVGDDLGEAFGLADDHGLGAAAKLKTPFLIAMPRSVHCCSVSPIEATCGCVYVARGWWS